MTTTPRTKARAHDLSLHDPAALKVLRKRVQAAAASPEQEPLFYDALFDGVQFDLPAPYPRTIIHPWGDLEIRVVNDFLGRICRDSYAKHKLLDTVIVVWPETHMPGGGFFKLAKQLGVLRGDRDRFFVEHRQAVFEHYRKS